MEHCILYCESVNSKGEQKWKICGNDKLSFSSEKEARTKLKELYVDDIKINLYLDFPKDVKYKNGEFYKITYGNTETKKGY